MSNFNGDLDETLKYSDNYSKPKSLNRSLSVGCTSQSPTGRNAHSAFQASATGLYKKPYE